MRRVTGTTDLLRARGSVAIIAALGLALTGCTGDEDTTMGVQSAATINTPAQIAQESDDNYDNNMNGLVTGATLQTWIDDWENNKPAGIEGRLVILDVAPINLGDNVNPDYRYITPDAQNGVLSYGIDHNRLTQVRSNGVIETVQVVPDGNQVDEFLKDYAIDPTKDMIVCAMGRGGNSQAMLQGRCWYMFRYWGAPKENLAVLSGGLHHPAVIDPAYLGTTATCDEVASSGACLPRNGRVSVRDLPEDNTALQATLGDVFDVVEGRANAFLWDARGAGEYNGTQFTGNNGSKQGHPQGAVLLPYANLLVSDDADAAALLPAVASYRYKPKADLWDYMSGLMVDGAQFQVWDNGVLRALSPDEVYQDGQTVITYCETTFRAMITGFASAAILGLPNRFYDGAMVEWNSLSAGVQDKYGSFILPVDSPWRTDVEGVSVPFDAYNDPANIDARVIDDPYAANAEAVVFEDRLYKYGSGSSDGDAGGGVSLPSNPCGG